MSGVAYNSWADLIPTYTEEAPVKAQAVEPPIPKVEDEEPKVQDTIALHKRLRLVRKKLRQIGELEAAQKKGAELDDDQLEKLSKKESLEAEQKELANVVEPEVSGNAAVSQSPEPEPEDTVQHVQELIAKSMESGAELETSAPEADVQPDEEVTPDPSPQADAVEPPAEVPASEPEPGPVTVVADTKGDEELALALAQEEEAKASGAQQPKSDSDGWMVQKAGGKVVPEKKKKAVASKPESQAAAAQQAAAAPPLAKPAESKPAAAPAAPTAQKPKPAPTAPAGMSEKEKEKERRKAALGKVKKGWLAASFAQRSVEAHRSAVSSIKIFKDRVLTAGFDNTVCEWELATGTLLKTYGGHTNSVRSVFAEENVYYSGGDDSMVRFWEASSGKLLRSLYCYAPVRCLTVADGVLYTGHSDCTIRAYEARAPGGLDSPKFTMRGHAAGLTGVAVYKTEEGLRLLSTDEGGGVALWDVEGRRQLVACQHPEGDKARRAVWLREEGRILSAHDKGSLLVWEAPYSGEPREMGASSEEGGRGCMHFDGAALIHAHALDDGAGALAFYLWATKELLYTVRPVDMEVACSMDVDGERIVVGGVDGWITVLAPVAAGARGAEVQVAPLLAPDKAKAARGQLPSQREAAAKAKKKKAKAKEGGPAGGAAAVGEGTRRGGVGLVVAGIAVVVVGLLAAALLLMPASGEL